MLNECRRIRLPATAGVAGCNEFITLHRYQYLLISYGPSNGVLCPVTTLSQPLSHGPHPLVTSHIYSPLTHVSSRIQTTATHVAQSFTPTTQNTTSPYRAATHRRKAPLLRPTASTPNSPMKECVLYYPINYR
jgi:hypothetical protein